jgi:hypothetical protein
MRAIEAKQSPVTGLNRGPPSDSRYAFPFCTHFPCTRYFAANPINIGRVEGKAAEQSWHHKALQTAIWGRQYDQEGFQVRPIG